MQTDDQITGPIFREAEKVQHSMDIDRTLKHKLWGGKNPFNRNMQYIYWTFSSNDLKKKKKDKNGEPLLCVIHNQEKKKKKRK